MRTIFMAGAFCLLTVSAIAQDLKKAAKKIRSPFGVIGGINLTQLPSLKTTDIKLNSNTSFVAGGFYEPSRTSRWGVRSELLYFRQGYNYSRGTSTGSVKLDYLALPQFTTFRPLPFLRVHAGVQMAILLKCKVDSSASPSSAPAPSKPDDFFSRFNFGYAAGLESSPIGGLIIGGRYNSFLDLLGDRSNRTTYPSYVPHNIDRLKHGTFQFYVGYRF
jgi:hypothetical protein